MKKDNVGIKGAVKGPFFYSQKLFLRAFMKRWLRARSFVFKVSRDVDTGGRISEQVKEALEQILKPN